MMQAVANQKNDTASKHRLGGTSPNGATQSTVDRNSHSSIRNRWRTLWRMQRTILHRPSNDNRCEFVLYTRQIASPANTEKMIITRIATSSTYNA
jgi:hypothetical protein